MALRGVDSPSESGSFGDFVFVTRQSEQFHEQTIELSVIWEDMTLMNVCNYVSP